MTYPLTDHTDGHTRLHRIRGMGVPQIMQTDPGQLRMVDDPRNVRVNVDGFTADPSS